MENPPAGVTLHLRFKRHFHPQRSVQLQLHSSQDSARPYSLITDLNYPRERNLDKKKRSEMTYSIGSYSSIKIILITYNHCSTCSHLLYILINSINETIEEIKT